MTSIDPATVRSLMDDRGQAVAFVREVKGTYDPTTGASGTISTDTENIIAAFVNYRVNLVDGVNVQRGDRQLLMSAFRSDGTALTKVPQAGDKFTGVGDGVNVVTVQKLEDGGTAIAYICQVRE